jgi:putative transposase
VYRVKTGAYGLSWGFPAAPYSPVILVNRSTPGQRRENSLHTTNTIESLNDQLRKVTKARGHFPADDAVVKLLSWPLSTSRTSEPGSAPPTTPTNAPAAATPVGSSKAPRPTGWIEALNELCACR